MPTYQYTCTDCGEPLEAVQSFTDAALTLCPACGGRLRKVFSAVGVVFKGSGFYRTDSRAGAPDRDGKGSDGKGSDGKGSDGKGSDGKGSDGKTADSGNGSDSKSSDGGKGAKEPAVAAAAPTKTTGGSGSSSPSGGSSS